MEISLHTYVNRNWRAVSGSLGFGGFLGIAFSGAAGAALPVKKTFL
jgi:hypothetical protein